MRLLTLMTLPESPLHGAGWNTRPTPPCPSRTEPDRRRRRAALDAGADALELDLHLTRDGVLVAAHAADAAACTDAVRCLSA